MCMLPLTAILVASEAMEVTSDLSDLINPCSHGSLACKYCNWINFDSRRQTWSIDLRGFAAGKNLFRKIRMSVPLYPLGFVFLWRFNRTYSEARGELLKVCLLFLVYRVFVARTKEIVEQVNVARYYWRVVLIFTDSSLKIIIIIYFKFFLVQLETNNRGMEVQVVKNKMGNPSNGPAVVKWLNIFVQPLRL